MPRPSLVASLTSLVLRRPLLAPVALAALLALPSISVGFFADDWVHLGVLERAYVGPEKPPFALYTFASGVDAEMAPLVARGPFPWWTHTGVRFAFFRPLASALRTLDHAAFGRAPLGYHLHSIAWYAALALAAALALRRALPGAAGVVAALLFAADNTHAMSVGWVAARHVLVGAAPALLGLAAHLRWREENWRPGLPLALLGLATGLLGSELALGALAYLAAYEVATAGEDRRVPAWRAALPAALLALAYVVVYRALDCGVRGSGAYLDPFQDPGRFAHGIGLRLGTLLMALVARAPAELWTLLPPYRVALASAGLAAAGVLGLLLRGAWPALAPDERRALRWLLPGAALSLAPGLAVFPGDRVLLFPGLGVAAAVAVLLRHAAVAGRAGAWRRGALAGVALVHGLVAPVALVGTPLLFAHFARGGERAAREAELTPAPGRDVVVVSAADPLAGMYVAALRLLDPRTRPRAWWSLSAARRDLVLTRTAPDAFELRVVDGRMLDNEFEHLFRSPHLPLRAGDAVALDGLRVTVLAAEGGGPTRVAFRFARPLDDPRYDVVAWQRGRLRRVALPPPGRSLRLAHEPGPMGM